MGQAKNEGIEHDGKLQEAMEIAIEAGVLQRCEFHSEYIYDGDEDISEAHDLADKKWSAKQGVGLFSSLNELNHYIDEAVDEYSGADSCGACEDQRLRD